MRRSVALATLAALSLNAAPASARRRPQPTPSPTPSPSPSPTPPSFAVRIRQLRRDLIAISRAAPGPLGIAVVDLLQYTRFAVNADQAFALASIVQLAIALVAFRRADQRKLDLDSRLDIEAADLRHGSSLIAQAHPHGGASYTVAELIRAMLIESDATASDRLLREIGGPAAIDAFLSHAGLSGFDVRKTVADGNADALAHRTFAKGADNSATPNAVANLLTGLATQQFLHFDSNNELLLLLAQTRAGQSRLAAGFSPHALFAHKAGTSATFDNSTDATNDAGILTLPDGRRLAIVAFLGASGANLATREAALANVARAVYRAYAP